MISVSSSGSFDRTEKNLRRLLSDEIYRSLDTNAAIGTAALAAATPVETSETANSWYHEVKKTRGGWTITWKNRHIEGGVNIAIILQYGHGTGTGGYVRGRDYINPALKPVFDQIATAVWKEVTRA